MLPHQKNRRPYCQMKISQVVRVNSKICNVRNKNVQTLCNEVLHYERIKSATVNMNCINSIIANYGFKSASFLSNPWFNDTIFACLYYNMHEPYKPIKFLLGEPKTLYESLNTFQMSFRKTYKNGGAHGNHLTSI